MKLYGVSDQGDVQKKLHIDDEGNIVVERIQDMEITKDYTRFMREAAPTMAGMRHIGFIPAVVIDQLKKQGLDIYNKDDMPKILAKLRTSEYSDFRTGKL